MANKYFFKKLGFTLIEILVSTFVTMLIFIAAWAVYMLGITWWHEVSPRIEAQRIARIALESIVEGRPDPTVGYDMIGIVRYNKRNGIGGTYYFAPTLPNTYVNPQGTTVSNEIDYGLYEDYQTYQPAVANNVRSFYLGLDGGTGKKAVYYRDNSGASHMVKGTLGISNLEFSYYVDKGVTPNVTYPDIIMVSVTVDKPVSGVGHDSYPVTVHYGYDNAGNLTCADMVYLRNIPQ